MGMSPEARARLLSSLTSQILERDGLLPVKSASSGATAGKEGRPEQYLFIFLKFISAVCPTIEYDYTLEVDGR